MNENKIAKRILVAYENYHTKPEFLNVYSIEDDLVIFMQIKKLITRFINSGEINEKLLLNKFIIISNLFKTQFIEMNLNKILDERSVFVANSFMIFLKMIDNSEYTVQSDRVVDDILMNVKARFNLPR